MWDIPTMTVIADSKRRVTVPARPGQRFDVQTIGDEKIVLTRLEPVAPRPARVTLKKVAGFTVMETDQTVNREALQRALEEFP